MFRRGFGHFLRTAASLQWHEAGIDLRGDAAAWEGLTAGTRDTLLRLLAGFVIGERSVALELGPFADAAAAGDPDIAACFEAQAVDEARHARFFERALVEVAGIEPNGARLHALVEPGLVELFERRLPATARELAAGDERLDGAVALYHLLLEGIVFTAGQLALLDLLEREPALPGLRRAVELVLRDERWHIGLGARLLAHAGARVETVAGLRNEGEQAIAVWGDAVSPALAGHVLELHRRRLGAAGLAAGAAARDRGAAYSAA